MTSALDEAARIADAVLFGNFLRRAPRTVSMGNRLRRLGVLVPPAFAAASGEPDRNRTECLLESQPGATLHIRLRFLHLRVHTVHDTMGRRTVELVVGARRIAAREEAVPREVDARFAVDELPGGTTIRFDFPDEIDVRPVLGGSVRRRLRPLAGRLELMAEPLAVRAGVLRLRLDVVNDSASPPAADRDTALRTSFIGTHSLLTVSGGGFFSATDPPEWARAATAELVSEHAWPVLAGPPGRDDIMLSSPVALPDHPQIERTTDLLDGIGVIARPRVPGPVGMQWAAVRATGSRAPTAPVDVLPPRFQPAGVGPAGALPSCPSTDDPLAVPDAAPRAPDTGAVVLVDGVRIARGSTVRLRPGVRDDVRDAVLTGRSATVHAVLRDGDGEVRIAVCAVSPGAHCVGVLARRVLYVRPDQIEPAP